MNDKNKPSYVLQNTPIILKGTIITIIDTIHILMSNFHNLLVSASVQDTINMWNVYSSTGVPNWKCIKNYKLKLKIIK